MTPEQITLVRDSWKMVVPISDQAAALFYGRLFELDPSLSKLFKGDMKSQGRKLMAMINTAVSKIDEIETIVGAVQDLGRRHIGYGVEEPHYATVGEALLWTLEQGLGDAFTAETKAAWVETYTTLSSVMIDAAAEVQPGVAASN